jgi:hypothetical protein
MESQGNDENHENADPDRDKGNNRTFNAGTEVASPS